MVLLGLLVLALACLVIGLVMANAIWLGASLVVSALAGYLLWRQRDRNLARAGGADKRADKRADKTAPKAAPRGRSLVTGKAFEKSPGSSGKGHDGNASRDVWVVDGQPAFHNQACAAIVNLDTEQIPLAQATEDGFSECTVCMPVASAGGTAAGAAAVWVVDGRPDYHAENCRSLKIAAAQGERDGEQIPRTQAVGDGFQPCPDCSPDGAAAAPRQAAPKTVWVIDGRPRYHRPDCLIIKDQSAEEIPLKQATEDGFMACSMCAPQAAPQPARSGPA